MNLCYPHVLFTVAYVTVQSYVAVPSTHSLGRNISSIGPSPILNHLLDLHLGEKEKKKNQCHFLY